MPRVYRERLAPLAGLRVEVEEFEFSVIRFVPLVRPHARCVGTKPG